jgi:hypothetical protein
MACKVHVACLLIKDEGELQNRSRIALTPSGPGKTAFRLNGFRCKKIPRKAKLMILSSYDRLVTIPSFIQSFVDKSRDRGGA